MSDTKLKERWGDYIEEALFAFESDFRYVEDLLRVGRRRVKGN